MSDELRPCDACETSWGACAALADESPIDQCCGSCWHSGREYDYGEAIRAPLSQSTIDALNARLNLGNLPVRRVPARPPVRLLRIATRRDAYLRRLRIRRRLESIRRVAWEERVRTWLSASVSMIAAGADWVEPIAPDRIPEDQRWENWFAMDEAGALSMALVRTYGCRCAQPLLGWSGRTSDGRAVGEFLPRCRSCGAQPSDTSDGEEEFGEDADWELINHADWVAENEGIE